MSDAPAEPKADSGPSPSKLPMILALVSTLATLAAAGTAVYTRILFKRPPITEDAERTKLEALKNKPKAPPIALLVNFDPVTINLKPGPTSAAAADEGSAKLHFATIGFSFQISDQKEKEQVERSRALIMDRFLALMGGKTPASLNSVQGRYDLKTQMAQMANEVIAATEAGVSLDDAKAQKLAPSDLVTDVFFTQFILQ